MKPTSSSASAVRSAIATQTARRFPRPQFQTCGFATTCLANNSSARTAARFGLTRRTAIGAFAPALATGFGLQAQQLRRMSNVKKIKVKNPVVELDGDEMT